MAKLVPLLIIKTTAFWDVTLCITCLFVAYLATLSVTQIVQRRMMINDELERMWKEAAVTHFNTLSQNSSGRSEENHENPHSE
jgi:hypothetical protein